MNHPMSSSCSNIGKLCSWHVTSIQPTALNHYPTCYSNHLRKQLSDPQSYNVGAVPSVQVRCLVVFAKSNLRPTRYTKHLHSQAINRRGSSCKPFAHPVCSSRATVTSFVPPLHHCDAAQHSMQFQACHLSTCACSQPHLQAFCHSRLIVTHHVPPLHHWMLL
jgi:hypothetical protein